jgi:hypothetical protein
MASPESAGWDTQGLLTENEERGQYPCNSRKSTYGPDDQTNLLRMSFAFNRCAYKEYRADGLRTDVNARSSRGVEHLRPAERIVAEPSSDESRIQ